VTAIHADRLWDTIIVGQGLAGTTLAWHLQAAGQQVLVLDADTPVTSSKIAAGLITPITGRRLALSWGFETFLPVAQAFYQDIETLTGQRFFHTRTAIRLLTSEAEQQHWSRRDCLAEYQAHLLTPQPNALVEPDFADVRFGGFAMESAQLDVRAYLAASRACLAVATVTVDWPGAVAFYDDHLVIHGYRGLRLISCEGHAASRNPYFSEVPFRAAKGDILTVRFQQPLPAQTVHRGVWLAPTAAPDVFYVGSTFDWDTLDCVPTPVARSEMEQKLKAFCRTPYTVIDHQAAVRPIIKASKPVLGMHPRLHHLGYFNGLGSKGALLAPWFAAAFTAFLVNGTALPDSANLRAYM
jgi:glycine oxidase